MNTLLKKEKGIKPFKMGEFLVYQDLKFGSFILTDQNLNSDGCAGCWFSETDQDTDSCPNNDSNMPPTCLHRFEYKIWINKSHTVFLKEEIKI